MDHLILEDLHWRHSVKKYDTSRKVSQENLDVLFEAMRLTASSIKNMWLVELEFMGKCLMHTLLSIITFNDYKFPWL